MPEARAYLGDGRLELDNNICERSIRPVAPGRKNCLFPGSVGGGEAAAIAYALIETAEMNNVDPEAWLTWVLERIADHRLTPSTNSCRGTGSPKTSKTRPDRTDTLELDNNICERSIRPVAPGRKNCLFPGSVGGGEAAAIAYALIETAKMNNVDPEAWLTWVLERIADHRLTPSTNLCRGTGSPKTSKTRPDRTDTHRRTHAVELEAPRPQKRGLTGRILPRPGSHGCWNALLITD